MPITFTGTGGKINNTPSNQSNDTISIDTSNYVTIKGEFDGKTPETAAYSSKEIKYNNPNAQSGWYWLNLDGYVSQYYIDMDYDGGGWVLVGARPYNTRLIDANYQKTAKLLDYSTNTGYNPADARYADPHNWGFCCWLSLSAWEIICRNNQRHGGPKQCVQYVSDRPRRLGEIYNHSKRSRWEWEGWTSTYAWRGARNLKNEVGNSTPGLWSYHIANGYSWTTYDNDQDAYSSNCAQQYGNQPFWYGACWDGNFWPDGGGYSPYVNWAGAGSDQYNFGAIYIR